MHRNISGTPARVLYFHQSSDLYGSDKTLLLLLERLDRDLFDPIVLLPARGRLYDALTDLGVETKILSVAKVSRSMFSFGGLWRFFSSLRGMFSGVDNILAGQRVDLVHSNTLATIGGALWARRREIPHVWHVHEIIQRPRLAARAFPFLLMRFSDAIICNSKATREQLLRVEHRLAEMLFVVWNGIDRPPATSSEHVKQVRRELGVNDGEVLITLAGRINRWKGQRLLVEAAERLRQLGQRQFHILIVGSPPPGQEHFLDSLRQSIKSSAVANHFTLMGYQDPIWPIWDATDIAVVPSEEPEPFGLVALEAMLARKPVIAAAHGGLLDIVEHDATGLLVPPRSAEALAHALHQLCASPQTRNLMGERGYERATASFGVDSYVAGVEEVYRRTLSRVGSVL